MVFVRQRSSIPRTFRGTVTAAAVFGLCASLVGPGLAQSASPPNGSFDDLLRGLDLKAKPTASPDFVIKTRPPEDQLHYIPVGSKHGDSPVKTMTPAEVAATTDQLDAARMAQQRRAGVKPAAIPLKAATPHRKTNR